MIINGNEIIICSCNAKIKSNTAKIIKNKLIINLLNTLHRLKF
jgi:hypothetical protein